MQLAHVEEHKVRGAYSAAEYLPARREMLAWWSDWLDGVEYVSRRKSARLVGTRRFGRTINRPQQRNSTCLYRMGFKGKQTGHGFRTLFSTVLNEHRETGLCDFSKDLIERCLDHCERGRDLRGLQPCGTSPGSKKGASILGGLANLVGPVNRGDSLYASRLLRFRPDSSGKRPTPQKRALWRGRKGF